MMQQKYNGDLLLPNIITRKYKAELKIVDILGRR